MSDLQELLVCCRSVAADPKAQLAAFVDEGKQVVGCLTYFCPEELVYAADMVPMGIWGANGVQLAEAKRYYPAFICSVLQTTLELGIRGEYDQLTALMVPILCDSLKGMGTNWEYGVKTVPVINVAHAQNRKCKAGVTFTASQYRKISHELEQLAGRPITDADVARGIRICNENRAALRAFIAAAGKHPELISPLDRNAVIKCGYFMEAPVHTELVRKITRLLEESPETPWKGLKIVTTGILADAPELLRILEENHIAVVDDQILQESVSFREDVPVTEDPYIGMAQRIGAVEGCSVLYDLGKKRASMLVEQAKAAGADGVLFVLTKFCDPEEYDFVPVKRMLQQAGIPLLQIEVDQQMTNYEQVRSAVQAFAESSF